MFRIFYVLRNNRIISIFNILLNFSKCRAWIKKREFSRKPIPWPEKSFFIVTFRLYEIPTRSVRGGFRGENVQQAHSHDKLYRSVNIAYPIQDICVLLYIILNILLYRRYAVGNLAVWTRYNHVRLAGLPFTLTHLLICLCALSLHVHKIRTTHTYMYITCKRIPRIIKIVTRLIFLSSRATTFSRQRSFHILLLSSSSPSYARLRHSGRGLPVGWLSQSSTHSTLTHSPAEPNPPLARYDPRRWASADYVPSLYGIHNIT